MPVSDRPTDRDLGDLYGAASAAATAIGDASKAVNLARRATELVDDISRPEGDADRERRAQARYRFAVASTLAGDVTTSRRLLEEAVGLVEEAAPSAVKARVLAGLAEIGSRAEAGALAERAIEIARAIGDRGIESRAMRTLGLLMADLGQMADGIDLLRRALALAIHDDDPTVGHQGYNSLSATLDSAGFVEESVEVALAGATSIRRFGGELSFRTFLEDNAAEGMIQLGRYADAAALLDGDLANLPKGRATHLHFTRAHAAVRQGDLTAARYHLEVGRSEAGPSPDTHMVFDVHTIGTEIELWAGHPAAALAIAQDVFDEFVSMGLRVLPIYLAIPAIHAAADIAVRARVAGDRSGALTAAAAARDVLDRHRAWTARVVEPDALASAQIAWRIGLLEAEAARATGEDDPANWESIRPALVSRPAPFLESYVLWRAAEAFAGRGDRASAADPLRTAHEIAVGSVRACSPPASRALVDACGST